MRTIKTHADALRLFHFFVAHRRGWENVKKRGNMVCWRDMHGGMIGPRRVWLTTHSNVYRIRGPMNEAFIKSVWPFEIPLQSHFELTVHGSEITQDFVDELLPFVASSFGENFSEAPTMSLFLGQRSYPSYAWSQKAIESEESHRIKANC